MNNDINNNDDDDTRQEKEDPNEIRIKAKIALEDIALTILKLIYSILMWGFVGYRFYYWFLFPIFDIPKLSLVNIIGIRMAFIAFLITGLANNIKDPRKSKDKHKSFREAAQIAAPIIVFLIGWVFKILFL